MRCLSEVWHRLDNACQVKPWIDVMIPASGEQRYDDTHIRGGFMVPAEEVVLASECYGTDFVLGKIVVKQQPSVISKH